MASKSSTSYRSSSKNKSSSFKRPHRSKSKSTKSDSRVAFKPLSKSYSSKSVPITAYQGPVKQRHCTDLFCLFVFAVVITGWIAIGLYVTIKSDKNFGLKPMDSFGNSCGRGKFSDRPYVFFFNLLECSLSMASIVIEGCNQTAQVCVSQCPSITFSVHDQLQNSFKRKRESKPWSNVSQEETSRDTANQTNIWLDYVICKYSTSVSGKLEIIKPTLKTIESLVKEKSCAPIYFVSEPMFGRCIPTVIKLQQNKVIDDFNNKSMENKGGEAVTLDQMQKTAEGLNLLFTAGSLIQNIFEDLTNSWKWVFGIVLCGVLLSIVWMYSLYYMTRMIVWISLILLIAIFVFLTYFCITRYRALNQSSVNETALENSTAASKARFLSVGSEAFQTPKPGDPWKLTMYYFRDAVKSKIDDKLSRPWLWLSLSIAASICLVILFLAVFILASRINLAVDLIKETSSAMANLRCTLLFPLIPYLLQLIAIVLWITISVIIFGAGRRTYLSPQLEECDPEAYANGTDSHCSLRRLFGTNSVMYAQLFSLFSFFWLLQFMEGCYIMSLAGCFSFFYWKPSKSSLPVCTFLQSFHITARYHLGTVALGSFIIALLRTLQWIIEFIYNRLKNTVHSTEPGFFTSIPWFLRVLKAFLYFFEKLMTYINRNVFIMTAIYGKSYCSAAFEAFSLLLNNKLRAIVLYVTSLYLMFVSKLCVTFLTGAAAYYFFQGNVPFLNDFSCLHFTWTPVIATVMITYFITDLYLGVYEVGIDTMFLCFLLDEKLNDGTDSKPFFMPNTTRSKLLKLDR